MSAGLDDLDVVRLQQQGVQPLSSLEGLALFDAAIARDEAVLVPARLHLTARALDPGASDAPLLRGLLARTTAAGGPAERGLTDAGLADRVRSLSPADAEAVLLDAVRAQTAIVLGHADITRIGPTVAFKDLGLDSLTALALRNKLAAVTGLKLPATLAFDYPNPGVLAQFLTASIAPYPDPDGEPVSVVDHLAREIEGLGARLEDAFAALADKDRTTISTLLGELQGRVRSMVGDGSPVDIVDRISSASAGELLSLLDKELG
jgi:acyl carrier protein